MYSDAGVPSISRVSCVSNMTDVQHQNSLDFIPKSDYSEKWHLKNRCVSFKQQCPGEETCSMEENDGRTKTSCDFCKHLDDKLKVVLDENVMHQKSGDWKHDEGIMKHSSETIIRGPGEPDWKRKNLYSVSNFDRWDRSCFSSKNHCAPALLREKCNNTGDTRKADPGGDRRRNFLHSIREYLVNYQESCGVPRTEYSFSALIRMMGQATGQSLLALLYVMLNIVPLAEVLLYVLRFILDKVINIRSSKNFRQTILRCFVFTTELLSVYVCLIFIFGFIVLPISQMVIGIIAKIMFNN